MNPINLKAQTARIFVQGSIQSSGSTIHTCKNSSLIFTDSSLSSTSRSWVFNGGLPVSSSVRSLSVTFDSSGTDTVFLTAYGISNHTCFILVDAHIKPDASLDTLNTTSSANFDPTQHLFRNCSASRSSPAFNFYIANVSSTTTSNTAYAINWGDGNTNSYPSSFGSTNHLYAGMALYTIQFTASNVGCSVQKNYIFFNGNTPAGSLSAIAGTSNCVPYTLTWPVDTLNTNQNTQGTLYRFHVNDSSSAQVFSQSTLPASITHTFTRSSCNASAINYFTVNLDVTNPCGTNPTSPGIVRPAQKPIAGISFATDSIACSNNSIAISNISSGNYFNGAICMTTFNKNWTITPSFGYTFNNGSLAPGGTNVYGSNTIGVTFNTQGVYTVKLKVSRPGSIAPAMRCNEDSVERIICIQPVPAPSFSIIQNPGNGCVANSISINNTSNTLQSCGTTLYRWMVFDSSQTSLTLLGSGTQFIYSNNTDSNSINPELNFLKKGPYKIRLQITNNCAGVYYKDTAVYVKDKPVVTFSPAAMYCDTQVIRFGLNPNHSPVIDSSYGLLTAFNWTVIPSSSTFISGNSNSRNPQILFPALGNIPITYKVILRASNVCGISTADTQSITINPKPVINAVPVSAAVCSGDTTKIALSCSLNPRVTYAWRAYTANPAANGFSNGTSSNSLLQQIIYNNSNNLASVTYKVTAMNTLSGCAADSVTVTSNVYPAIKVYASGKSVCSGNAIGITLSTNVGNALYSWRSNPVSGHVTGYSNRDSFLNAPLNQVLYNTDSLPAIINYTIKAKAYGCISADSTIQVKVDPTPSITNTILTQKLCDGDTARFNPVYNSASVSNNFTASILSGNASGYANGSGNILQRVTITGNNATVIRYRLTPQGTTFANCVGIPVNFDVSVYPKPRASFTNTGADSGCSPLIVNYINTSDAKNGESINTMNFAWTVNNSSVDSNKNKTVGFTNTGVVDSINTIKLIALTQWGCKDTFNTFAKVFPFPKSDFSATSFSGCAPFNISPTTINLQAYPIANSIYTWQILNRRFALQSTSYGMIPPIYIITNPDDSVYYRLITTNNRGCRPDTLVHLFKTVNDIRPGFIISDSIACSGSNILFSNTSMPATGLLYIWQTRPGQIISTLKNPVLNFVNYGVTDTVIAIKLIINTGTNGCVDSLTKYIVIKPLPRPDFSVNDSVICTPSSLNVFTQTAPLPAVNSGSFKWKVLQPGSTISNDTSNTQTTIQFNNNQSGSTKFYTIRLTNRSAFGCTDSTEKTIRVPSRPVSGFHFDSDTLCGGSFVNAVNTTLYGSGYNWFSYNTGLKITDTASINSHIFLPEHKGLVDSLYRIRLISITSEGCADTLVQKLKVVPNPVVTFVSNKDSGCAPLTVRFTNNTQVKGPATFLWDFGNGQSSILFNPLVTSYFQSMIKDTTYYVQFTVSNYCGSFVYSDSIKVFPKPIVSFVSDIESGCSPILVHLLNQTSGLPQSIKWFYGNGDSSLQNNLQAVVKYTTADTPTVYKLKLLASNGCGTDSMVKYISVLPNTVHAFISTPVNTLCQNTQLSFQDQSIGGTNTSWNFGDGSTDSIKNPTHIYTQPGTYKAYQYVNNNCSYDTSSVLITVKPNPAFTIKKSVIDACVNTPVKFNSILNDSGSIYWQFGDSIGSSFYNPSHSYKSTGKKIISATLLSSVNNCTSMFVDSINVQPQPIIAIITDTLTACRNHTFYMQAVSNENNNYSWSFGDGDFAIGARVVHTYLNAGSYNLKLKATNGFGCADSVSTGVLTLPIPVSSFSYTPHDTCSGPALVQFINQSQNAAAYLWNFGNGNTSTNTNASQIFTALGTYPVQLISTNEYNCSDTITHNFSLINKPLVAFYFDDASGCAPFKVVFNNKSSYSKNYLWNFGDGETSTIEAPVHTYLSSGNYTVTLISYAGEACIDTVIGSTKITVYPKPIPSITMETDVSVKPNRLIKFNATCQGGKNFEWIFSGGNKKYGQTVYHRFGEADSGWQIVKLKVWSQNNCDSTITDSVYIPGYWKGLYVPNAFTPDYGSDAVRVFKPAGNELKSYHLSIFNKWGEALWETTSIMEGHPAVAWNGYDSKGNECMQGTYIWMIEATFTDGTTWEGMEYKGRKYTKANITLIR